MFRFVLAALLVVVTVSEAQAWPWGRRARRSNNTYTYNYSNNGNYRTYTNYASTQGTYGGGPQSVAAAKAQRSAQLGLKGQHLGGGFGGAYAEGVGFSSYSAQHALNSCCFTGQRTVAGQAVVQGHDGWYAVKLYW